MAGSLLVSTMKGHASKIISTVILLVVVVAIGVIYYTVISDVIDMARLGNGSAQEIREYLDGFGALGALVLSCLQAMQMIVVFIPAEFVQISAGLAYPIYFAIPICTMGICMGATLIFLLVRVLKLRMEYLEKTQGKVAIFVSTMNKNTPISLIMYILFIMPIIPFGAICYFASTSKISYKKYIVTCAVGTIPSILTSYFIGNVMNRLLGRSPWEFALVLAATILLAVMLLATLVYIVKRMFMTNTLLKPNALVYYPLLLVARIFAALKYSFKVKKGSNVKKIKGPALILASHTSFYDIDFVLLSFFPKRLTFVANRYYTQVRGFRFWARQMSLIPKRLFYPDVDTIRKIYSAKQAGHLIVLFPEGRLSVCGQSYPMAQGTAELVKKLGIDVYRVYGEGAYFINPKWATNKRRGKINVHTELLYTSEQLADMSVDYLNESLHKKMYYDENKIKVQKHKCKDRAKGLDGILYHCPQCHSYYKLHTENNKVVCSNCGYSVYLDEQYRFVGGKFDTIGDWYNYQAQLMSRNLDTLRLQTQVTVSALNKKHKMDKIGEGFCSLDKDYFTYKGVLDGEDREIVLPTSRLEALAFSCSEEFEFYHENRLLYFYPVENRYQCVRWALFVDQLTKRRLEKKAKGLENATAAKQESSQSGQTLLVKNVDGQEQLQIPTSQSDTGQENVADQNQTQHQNAAIQEKERGESEQ